MAIQWLLAVVGAAAAVCGFFWKLMAKIDTLVERLDGFVEAQRAENAAHREVLAGIHRAFYEAGNEMTKTLLKGEAANTQEHLKLMNALERLIERIKV